MDQFLKLHMYKLATLAGGIVATILGVLICRAVVVENLAATFNMEGQAAPGMGASTSAWP
jgi:high-affinity Fe2+/Pb2+ permease